ncbi:MAG: Spore protein YabP [Pelotomaculum sp. PtaU1.Bin035]|nr:MAG: Spore protein YabP [Pelotomaculum sp. PtaU1.Bin035]
MNERVGHSIAIHGRKQLAVEGVQHVGSFDDSGITLETNMGTLVLKGEGLHITQLSLETGTVAAEGFFASLQYVEDKGKAKGKGLLSRILK